MSARHHTTPSPPAADAVLEDRRLVLVAMNRPDGEAWLAAERKLNLRRYTAQIDAELAACTIADARMRGTR